MAQLARALLTGAAVVAVTVVLGSTAGWGVALMGAAGAGLLALLLFVGLYVTRSDWRSPEGIVLLGDKAMLAVLLGMLLLGRAVGGLGLTVWSVAIALLAAVMWRWVVLLLRAQRRGRTRRRDPLPKE